VHYNFQELQSRKCKQIVKDEVKLNLTRKGAILKFRYYFLAASGYHQTKKYRSAQTPPMHLLNLDNIYSIHAKRHIMRQLGLLYVLIDTCIPTNSTVLPRNYFTVKLKGTSIFGMFEADTVIK
jgi:hypothetical protein